MHVTNTLSLRRDFTGEANAIGHTYKIKWHSRGSTRIALEIHYGELPCGHGELALTDDEQAGWAGEIKIGTTYWWAAGRADQEVGLVCELREPRTAPKDMTEAERPGWYRELVA